MVLMICLPPLVDRMVVVFIALAGLFFPEIKAMLCETGC